MKAEELRPVTFDIGRHREIQVVLTEDGELTVRLYGRRCGKLLIVPAANNSTSQPWNAMTAAWQFRQVGSFT